MATGRVTGVTGVIGDTGDLGTGGGSNVAVRGLIKANNETQALLRSLMAKVDRIDYQLQSNQSAEGYLAKPVLSCKLLIDNAAGLIVADNQATPHFWNITLDSTGAITTTDLGTDLETAVNT